MPQITSDNAIDIELLEVNAKLKQLGFRLSGKLDSSERKGNVESVHLKRESNGFFDNGEIWYFGKKLNTTNNYICVPVLNKELFDVLVLLETIYKVSIEIKLE